MTILSLDHLTNWKQTLPLLCHRTLKVVKTGWDDPPPIGSPTYSADRLLPGATTTVKLATLQVIAHSTLSHHTNSTASGNPSADGQVLGNSVNNYKATNTYNVLTSAAAYHIHGHVFTTQASFLLDNGTAVSLLWKDIWDHLSAVKTEPLSYQCTGSTTVARAR